MAIQWVQLMTTVETYMAAGCGEGRVDVLDLSEHELVVEKLVQTL